MTWNSVVDRCFTDEARTKMQACYNLKSDELLRKVRFLPCQTLDATECLTWKSCDWMQNVAKRQSLRVPWVPYVRGLYIYAPRFFASGLT